MTAAKAILLGLIQGIAEFLPISSSGHLEIFKNILGLSDVPLVFDVILHVATLLVVCIVFWKRIAGIFEALWRYIRGAKPVHAKATSRAKKEDAARKDNLALVVPIIVATAITGVLGYIIEKFVPQGGVRAVSVRMLITAVILGLTAIAKPGARGPREIGLGRSAAIGLAQGIGVFSGISRSGITISAGIFAGLDRKLAGEFSFLLSIPAILGALLLTLKDAGSMMASVSFGQLALAFLAAFLSGFASLKLLMKVIKSGKLYWFAPYLVVVGVLGLILG